MAALQYVEVPGYAALILRRTLKMLNQEDGLIPRSKEWLAGKATYNETAHKWTFPSGATLTFGYLDHDRHLDNYQGGAWHYVAFDEAAQFPESRYRYLFSRQRKLKTFAGVPIRLRAASNPGGPGHDWLKKRFITGVRPKFFVPARLADNPGLEALDYIRSLKNLDPIRLRQLLAGDWDAYAGGRFEEKWFKHFTVKLDKDGNPRYCLTDHTKPDGLQDAADGIHVGQCWNFLICDPACTEDDVQEGGSHMDPSTSDPTVIGAFAMTPAHDLLVLKVVRKWLDIEDIPPEIQKLADGFSPEWVGIEDNGFAIGITRGCQKLGITVKSLSPEGKGKLVRATPAIIRASNGQIFLPEKGGHSWQGPDAWGEEFVSECVQFTGNEKLDAHDDQVDALAYAVQAVERFGTGGITAIEPERVLDDLQEWYGGQEFGAGDEREAQDFGGLVGWER
jgi:predicted phage terminase large subunit-like protein